MIKILSKLRDVGIRLRLERERSGMNQTDFAAIADVTRGSQQGYELGQRPFPVSYLLALEAHGIDIIYILTGKRFTETIAEDEAHLLKAYDALEYPDRSAVLRLACSAAGLASPPMRIALPSSEALEDAMSGLLEEGTQWTPAALVHEIARSLPTILRSAEDEITVPASDQPGTARALRAISDVDQPSTRQGTRT